MCDQDPAFPLLLYGGTNAGHWQWKVLVVDEASRKLIDNAVKEDDILNLNVTSKLAWWSGTEACMT